VAVATLSDSDNNIIFTISRKHTSLDANIGESFCCCLSCQYGQLLRLTPYHLNVNPLRLYRLLIVQPPSHIGTFHRSLENILQQLDCFCIWTATKILLLGSSIREFLDSSL
jgi:hypothetical protein